jgi:hypothetical protein
VEVLICLFAHTHTHTYLYISIYECKNVWQKFYEDFFFQNGFIRFLNAI